jgi:hypothetical protein
VGLNGERPVVSEASGEYVINSRFGFLSTSHATQSSVLYALLLATEHLGPQPVVSRVLEEFGPQVALSAESVRANFSASDVTGLTGIHFGASEVEGVHEFMSEESAMHEGIVDEICT